MVSRPQKQPLGNAWVHWLNRLCSALKHCDEKECFQVIHPGNQAGAGNHRLRWYLCEKIETEDSDAEKEACFLKFSFTSKHWLFGLHEYHIVLICVIFTL